ncbi:hypothetical protein BRD19_12435 [Halobacteriales archaeon SW_7_65_23]|nr:MAG: hypothetical protein BRD19_12435 [Halobacteriales archaeon SW_7_65_23]
MTDGSEDSGDDHPAPDDAPDQDSDSQTERRGGADRSATGHDESGAVDPTIRSDERVEPADLEHSENGDRGESTPAAGDEGEWRYTVEEVGGTDEADEEGNVAGILMRNEPLEAESIDLENALFFLLGSLGAIAFVVLALASL